MSEQPKFSGVPDKPFPITVHPVGQEHLAVRGPGVDITLCVHGAHTLAGMLVDAANKQYCDGYIHGDASTMLTSPKTPSQPTTITDAYNKLFPPSKSPPTCKTLDELLLKIQAFVQENPNVQVISLDDIPNRLWGYSASFVKDGLETSIFETVSARDIAMSDSLKDSLMPSLKTAAGRLSLAKSFEKGVRFVSSQIDTYPKIQPTCKDFEELLRKVQDFVQEHPGACVTTSDSAKDDLIGYSAYVGQGDQEVSIWETVTIKGLKLPESLREFVGQILRTPQGRVLLAEHLAQGHKFVLDPN